MSPMPHLRPIPSGDRLPKCSAPRSRFASFFRYVVIGLLSLACSAYGQDYDFDLLPDSWEADNGLSSSHPFDSLDELVGANGVPALWQWAEAPAYTVDPTATPDATTANTLPGILTKIPTNGWAIVRVRAGIYTAGVDCSASQANIAWIAESGVILRPTSGSAFVLTASAAIIGFTIEGPQGGAQTSAIRVEAGTALYNPSYLPRTMVVLRNTLIRDWKSTAGNGAGAIFHRFGRLYLHRTTITGCSGLLADAIYNFEDWEPQYASYIWQSTNLTRSPLWLRDSTLWNPDGVSQVELRASPMGLWLHAPADIQPVRVTTSTVRGGAFGASATTPALPANPSASLPRAALVRGAFQVVCPMTLSAPIIAEFRDSAGNPVANAPVTLITENTPSSFRTDSDDSFANVSTDAQGRVELRFQASSAYPAPFFFGGSLSLTGAPEHSASFSGYVGHVIWVPTSSTTTASPRTFTAVLAETAFRLPPLVPTLLRGIPATVRWSTGPNTDYPVTATTDDLGQVTLSLPTWPVCSAGSGGTIQVYLGTTPITASSSGTAGNLGITSSIVNENGNQQYGVVYQQGGRPGSGVWLGYSPTDEWGNPQPIPTSLTWRSVWPSGAFKATSTSPSQAMLTDALPSALFVLPDQPGFQRIVLATGTSWLTYYDVVHGSLAPRTEILSGASQTFPAITSLIPARSADIRARSTDAWGFALASHPLALSLTDNLGASATHGNLFINGSTEGILLPMSSMGLQTDNGGEVRLFYQPPNQNHTYSGTLKLGASTSIPANFSGSVSKVRVFGWSLDANNSPQWQDNFRSAEPISLANLNTQSPDLDQDGLANIEEYQAGTDPYAADSDADQMLDDYEVTFQLDPLADDAYLDADGDRVPNLWESSKLTDPRDPQDTPEPDAWVTPSTTPRLGVPNFASLASAVTWINSATAAVPTYPIIAVAYDAKATSSVISASRPSLWLAEPTAWPQHMKEGANLEIKSSAVLDGFTFDGKTRTADPPSALTTLTSPAIRVTASSGTALTARLVNIMIRSWQPKTSSNASTFYPGALIISGGNVTLNHCTLYDSPGSLGNTRDVTIDLRSGSLNIENSILWNLSGPSNPIKIATGALLERTSSLVQGYDNASDPQLSAAGYLSSSSTPCFGAASQRTRTKGTTTIITNASPAYSITGWPRERENGTTDIGADHWQNTDAAEIPNSPDHLPDWWEYLWIGEYSLADSDRIQSGASEPDLITRYLEGRVPTSLLPFSSSDPSAWSYSVASQAPTVTDTILSQSVGDLDYDGIVDAHETKLFGGTHRDGYADADEDGLSDRIELAPVLTSPPAAWISQPLLWDSGQTTTATSGGDRRRDLPKGITHGNGTILIHPSRGIGSYPTP